MPIKQEKSSQQKQNIFLTCAIAETVLLDLTSYTNMSESVANKMGDTLYEICQTKKWE
jgi:hypothetical protein